MDPYPVTPNETRSSAHPGVLHRPARCQTRPIDTDRPDQASDPFILPFPTVHGRRHTQQGTPCAPPWLWYHRSSSCSARGFIFMVMARVICQSRQQQHQHHCPVTEKKNLWRRRGEERQVQEGPSLRRRSAFAVKQRSVSIFLPSLQKQSKQPIKPQKQTSVVKTTYQIPPGPTLVPRIVESRGPQRHPAPDRVQNLPESCWSCEPLKDIPFNLPV
jgi:hypothetical protein